MKEIDKQTMLICIDHSPPEEGQLELPAQILRQGGLVVFPTETVYGLGANALDPVASRGIFAAKGRPSDNPLIVHVSCFQDVHQVAVDIPPLAGQLADKFWPGPLTFVLPKREGVPHVVTGGLDSVAVRQPNHPLALALLEQAGVPVAAPSANLSGKVSPTSAQDVVEDLWGRVDVIIDGGRTGVGLESTVVDLTVWPPLILRPGGITLEVLRQVVPDIELDPGLEGKIGESVPRSPGVKYTHYSPRAPLVLVGSGDGQVAQINRLIRQYQMEGKRVGLLCFDESRPYLSSGDVMLGLGSRGDLQEAGHQLFGQLRQFDRDKVDVILVEGVPKDGIGLAIMNRLTKAATEIY